MNEIKYKLSEDGCTVTGYEIPKIEIPEGVTTIEEEAFFDMKYLKSVKLPSTITTIEEGAFAQCRDLEEINFPAALSYLGDAAFASCSSLKRVNIEPGNDHFVVVNGVLYTSDMSVMVRALDSPENSHIILTEKQKSAHTGALCGCPSVTHFTFARNVDSVGDGFFVGCENLKQVDLVDGIMRIGTQSFYKTGIENIDLPNTIEEIADCAFAECHSLKKITIPENVKILHSYTFAECESLETVELGKKTCLIVKDAFDDFSVNMRIIVPEDRTIATYNSISEIEDYVTEVINDDNRSDILFVPYALTYFMLGGKKLLKPKDTIEMIRRIEAEGKKEDDDTSDGDCYDYPPSLDDDPFGFPTKHTDNAPYLDDDPFDSLSNTDDTKNDVPF